MPLFVMGLVILLISKKLLYKWRATEDKPEQNFSKLGMINIVVLKLMMVYFVIVMNIVVI